MESSKATITSEPHGSAVYTYQPIHSKSEIRILELYPPDPRDLSGALHGNLITARLADKPSYEAISYVWGEPNFSEALHLSAGTLGITPNLAAALRRFRYPNKNRRLWADAVCIDQQSGGDEKGHQVQLMGEVFKSAEHVLAWLGDGDGVTDAVIVFLETLANESWRFGVISERPYESLLKYNRASPEVRAALKDLCSLIDANQELFERFFKQKWFERLWIVQEFALASKLILYNGTGALSYEILSRAIALVHLMVQLPSSPAVDLVKIIFGEVIHLVTIRWSQQTDMGRVTLLDLIVSTCDKKHANELDCIYALLGLSRLDDEVNIEVNYGLGLNDLWKNLALEYLSRGSLEVLRRAGKQAEESSAPLPSWARVFKRTSTRPMILWSERNNRNDQRGLFTMLKPEIIPLIGIRGTLIDTTKVEMQVPNSAFQLFDGDEDRSHALIRMRETLSQNRRGASYYTGESEESAFARTLMVDGMLAGSRLTFYDTRPLALVESWLDFKQTFFRSEGAIDRANRQTITEQQELKDYIGALKYVLEQRVFFITRLGYIGVAPAGMEADDAIVTFDGHYEGAFVLRRVEEEASLESGQLIESSLEETTYSNVKEKWELIGSCYLHGFMDGEAEQPKFEDRRQMFFIQ